MPHFQTNPSGFCTYWVGIPCHLRHRTYDLLRTTYNYILPPLLPAKCCKNHWSIVAKNTSQNCYKKKGTHRKKHRGPLQKTLENCCKKHHRRKKHRCKLEKHHCQKIHHLLLEKHQFPTQFTQGSPKAKFCNFCIPFQPIVKPILQYKSFCPWKQHHSWLWILKKHGKIPWGMSMAFFHILLAFLHTNP